MASVRQRATDTSGAASRRDASRRDGSGGGRGSRGRPRTRRTVPAHEVWKAYVVALVVFVMLASGNLVHSAEGMPLGWQRDVSLTTAKVIDRVANLLSINRPYDWAAEQLGLEQRDADFDFAAESTDPDDAAGATTTTLPALRIPTPADPLRVSVVGDSTSIGVGDRLKVAAVDAADLSVDVEGKVATGLTRSDYFNWGAGLKEVIGRSDPEVVLFMIGANDAQSIVDPDGTIVAMYGTDEWREAYRQRVGGIMDLAHSGSRRMVWVGQPTVGNPKVQAAADLANQLAQEEAATRPWVTYFDLAKLVAGPDGEFSEFITLPDGKQTRCFSGDSVHLSLKCLDYAVGSLLPTIEQLSGASATTSTTVEPSGTTASTTPATTTARAPVTTAATSPTTTAKGR